LLVSTSATAACPRCGTSSDRIHSHYRRTVADLPCQDRPVALRLVVRRFRCIQPACPQTIFCERLPALLDAHARSTVGLTGAHRTIGFALGGEAGARLAEHLEMPTSPDTLLRRVKDSAEEPAPPARYVGVDDWAFRKGQRYGTILIDLERGRVIDLLPGRDGAALKRWLKEHPQVEIVSRDRWPQYAAATSEAAPQARQVADRWHLLKNLREAVERLFERHYAQIRDAFRPSQDPTALAPQSMPEPGTVPRSQAKQPHPATPIPPPGSMSCSAKEQARQTKRHRRAERFQRVGELHTRGYSLRRIARELGMSKGTVLRHLRSGHCPDWKPGQARPTRLDGFRAYVDLRIEQGCVTAAELFRELSAKGCDSSYDAVRRFVNRRLAAAGRKRQRANAAQSAPPPPSPRKLSFDFIHRAEERKPEQQGRVDLVRGADADLAAALDLAAELAAMLRKQSVVSLKDWLAKALASPSKELRIFGDGLRADEAAVAAALSEKWSNGPVEGQVNRLKTIKRQMYGRAGLKLLRARVLHAG
jgi:transposase